MQKQNRKMMKKIVLSSSVLGALLLSSSSVYAFDFGSVLQGFKDFFSVKAGSKSVDDADGYDLDKFQTPGKCQADYPWGPPVTKDKEILNRSLYMCRNNYAIQYDPKLKVGLWTQEVLRRENLLMGISGETEYYKPDPEIPPKMQASVADYDNSGYVKLSLAPAFDMPKKQGDLDENQLKEFSKKSLDEAFYMTNQVPIRKSLMAPNGLWTQLENQTRGWAIQRNEVYVITGPIYLGGQTKGFMGSGQNRIAIPTHYFKIITQPLTYGSIAYIIPNREVATDGVTPQTSDVYYCGENGAKRNCTLDDFIVPIKEVERLTGFETYSKLAPTYAVRVKQDINELFKKKQ
jgi:DNA/RNA endonuclease G (NUC1)